ncbi:hypothetical protein NKH47_30380 [Mesorhizobium sp. M1060]|uniref:hypothetical protein n=1 Tax=unclassified Mesorhizobium TaxID=325217 RepID=UPI0003CEF44F|nr:MULTISPECIES: hypothetical protein [unclassified Mesorhizobium]ESX05197.1 hypothetical protein X768_28050 [Mesorhizobium sp. LSJC265A00]ESX15649.1 hypothetical protein X766_25655 [Mesorhizobium sp. LSJC255A00]
MDFKLMVNIAGGILLAIAIPSVCLGDGCFAVPDRNDLKGESCDNEKPATVPDQKTHILAPAKQSSLFRVEARRTTELHEWIRQLQL